MAIRKIKPNTPGQRFMTVSTYEEITCTTPERSLMESLKSNAGRNNKGRIKASVSYHRLQTQQGQHPRKGCNR